MKKRRTIIKALMALLVILLGVNFNAEAQLGGLINAAKNKAKQNKAEKAQEERLNKTKPIIPQPEAGGSTVIFSVQDTAVAMWNPATLELTITTTKGGNTPGSIYKVDASTGKVTDQNGASKGSMSNDGTIVSPNLGNLKLVTLTRYTFGRAYSVEMDSERLGTIDYDCNVSGKLDGSASTPVSSLLTAYVYYGLMLSKKDYTISKFGYDPDRKYTVEELEDKIEWKNASAENEVMEYESSRPYAGFDREKFPHLKNCKVAAVGLMSDWKESKDTYTTGGSYSGTTWHKTIQYWVVYELTDGRNIVAFNYLDKYYGKEEGTKRGNKEFHDVTDWVRK